MDEAKLKAINVCVVEKEFKCAVCAKLFKNNIARKMKIRTLESEVDLRPICEPIDPTYYDVVICNHCGYSTLLIFAEKKCSAIGLKLVREKVTPNFEYEEYPKILSGQDALKRFKIAMNTAEAKNSDFGEKAYISLKTAWVYRSLQDKENEMIYLKQAASLFEKAYVEEEFPICQLDEPTFCYLVGAIYSLVEDYKSSLRWVSQVLVAGGGGVSPRLRERSFDLKVDVQNALKKEEEAAAKAKG